MKKILIAAVLALFSQGSFAYTVFSNYGPTTRYSWPGEPYRIDYSRATLYNSVTGVTKVNPVIRVDRIDSRSYYNLTFPSSGNYFIFTSASTDAYKQFALGARPFLYDGTGSIFITDYKMNVLPTSSLLQLLYVPTITASTWNGIVPFLASAYDRSTGQKLKQEDLELRFSSYPPYQPQHGTISVVSYRNDVVQYVADPGYVGPDSFLVYVRGRDGKMGYQFYNVNVVP